MATRLCQTLVLVVGVLCSNVAHAQVARSQFNGIVTDSAGGVLVGATAVGPAGGEVLSMLTVAVHGEVPVSVLRSMHFAYPTYHRAVQTALADLGDDLR